MGPIGLKGNEGLPGIGVSGPLGPKGSEGVAGEFLNFSIEILCFQSLHWTLL